MEKYLLGIDDAGRGPVIGPMVIAGILIREENEFLLKKIGAKDSKMLFPEQRKIMFKQILELAEDTHIEKILPQEIDKAVFNKSFNLNTLEAAKIATVINEILGRLPVKEKQKAEIKIIVDCPSPNISKWKETMKSFIEPEVLSNKNLKLNFYVEHKADVNHLACSAASIVAKVTRDDEIEKLKSKTGIDFGSGYPADPITCAALKKHEKELRSAGVLRESWGTLRKSCEKTKGKQKKLGEF
ncbi:ribonuclease HII [Candidatus Pacearchaeota archaeon CG06_land_8_20_14_3_00_35_12]|nr:MAG: ribonuclease HII [Candidatus Pacearchaeota archaeon CG06_land_8_20_14_3_00_35_12]